MRNLLLFFLLLSTSKIFGQPTPSPMRPSRNDALATDAGTVFRTNKFLDFKNQDTLVETIDQVVYAITDLNKEYGPKKDWKKIEAEDTSTYRRPVERYPTTTYHYTYTDTSMTESYRGSSIQSMSTAWKTVYNLKGFITYEEKKSYIDKKLVATKSTTNTFDRRNRVTRIVEKSVSSIKELNSESIIRAVYAGNTVTITSENGTIVCKLISDGKTQEPVSELSARRTAEQFMYALRHKQFDVARAHCTVKMAKVVKDYATPNFEIEDLAFQKGRIRLTSSGVTINDIWRIKFASREVGSYQVNFVVVKQTSGWKIDDFKISRQ